MTAQPNRVVTMPGREIVGLPTPAEIIATTPAIDWLVPDVLPRQAFVLLAGAPGSFKWWLAWDLCRTVAAGASWAGRQAQAAAVLYIDKENPQAIVAERLRLWPAPAVGIRYWGSWLAEPRFSRLTERSAAYDWHLGSAELFRYAENARPLLVFDSFVRFHDQSEIDTQRMSGILELFTDLARAGATVLLLHHTNQEGGPRGASEIQAAPDIVYQLERKRKSVVLRTLKTRFGADQSLSLTWTPRGFTPGPPRLTRQRSGEQGDLF